MNEQAGTQDWASMSSVWRSISGATPLDADALRTRVNRETRRIRLWLGLDVVFSVAVIAATLWMVATHRAVFALIFAADVWVVLGIVWLFAAYSGRGLYHPAARSTSDYIALTRRHASRRLNTVHLVLALLIGQMVVVIALLLTGQSFEGPLVLRAAAVAGVGLWILWAVRTRARAKNELRELDALQEELR